MRVRERPLPADRARLGIHRVDGVVASDDEHASRRSLRHVHRGDQRRRQGREHHFSRRRGNLCLPLQREPTDVVLVEHRLGPIPERAFLIVAPRQPLVRAAAAPAAVAAPCGAVGTPVARQRETDGQACGEGKWFRHDDWILRASSPPGDSEAGGCPVAQYGLVEGAIRNVMLSCFST